MNSMLALLRHLTPRAAGLLALVALVNAVLAVPANPQPREVKQPDGTTVLLVAQGDERQHWFTDGDGYTVLYSP